MAQHRLSGFCSVFPTLSPHPAEAEYLTLIRFRMRSAKFRLTSDSLATCEVPSVVAQKSTRNISRRHTFRCTDRFIRASLVPYRAVQIDTPLISFLIKYSYGLKNVTVRDFLSGRIFLKIVGDYKAHHIHVGCTAVCITQTLLVQFYTAYVRFQQKANALKLGGGPGRT